MAQGNKKQNAKTPALKSKVKQKVNLFKRRGNAPVLPKKSAFMEAEKLKSMVTKTVNKKIEVEMRSRAVEGKINISKAQEAVVKYHKLKKNQSDSDTASRSTIT